MKVRQVTKIELTSWRMALKLGRDSARKRRIATMRERKTVRFTLNAKFVILITVKNQFQPYLAQFQDFLL